jgi:hypothetical protein
MEGIYSRKNRNERMRERAIIIYVPTAGEPAKITLQAGTGCGLIN